MSILNNIQLVQLAYDAGFNHDENELVDAVAAAIGESGGNTQARGDGGASWGLWQIHLPSHPEYGNNPQQLFNPKTNAEAAHKVYAAAGNNFEPFHALSHASLPKKAELRAKAFASVQLWKVAHPGAAFGLAMNPPQNATIPNPFGAAVDVAEAVNKIGEATTKAGQWLSTPANLGRLAIAIGGVIVVIAGIVVLMRPVLEEGIKAVGAVKP